MSEALSRSSRQPCMDSRIRHLVKFELVINIINKIPFFKYLWAHKSGWYALESSKEPDTYLVGTKNRYCTNQFHISTDLFFIYT